MQINPLSEKANKLRKMVLQSVYESGCGHVSTSMSCAEILAVLYFGRILRYRADEPEWNGRDRFFLSKGHAATIFYCALAEAGFIPESLALNVGQQDSRVGVHLQADIPGVEATSGSLGQGLGLACGAALAARADRKNHLTFVLTGDGELNEGSIWESAMFAGAQRLNNLVWIIDRNYMQCGDYTENVIPLEPLAERIRTFNFEVRHCDGNHCGELLNAFKDVRKRITNKPLCIIAETTKGKGIPAAENDLFTHFYIPQKGEIPCIIKALECLEVDGK